MTDTQLNKQIPIEQAIESGATPSQELAAALLKDFYAPVFQLSLALLNCAEAAQRLTLEILCEALPKLSRLRGKPELEITIFQIALRMLKQSTAPHEKQITTENAAQQSFITWIEQLDDLEQQFFFLYYLLDLQTSQIGKILHVSQSAVRAQIRIIQQQSAALFASQADEPALKDMHALEQRVREIISSVWPAPQPSSKELETYTQQVLDCAARTPDKKLWGDNVRRNILLGGVGLGLLLTTLGTGYFMWQSRGSSSMPPPAEPTAQGTLVQVPQPLTSRSTSEQIKARILESASLWSILWADIQMTDYGAASYIGPQKSYRGQVWIKQPAESLELFGALGQKPNSIYIMDSAQILYENPVAGESISAVSTEAGSELLHNPVLEQLIFPAKGPWITQGGWLQAQNTSKIAGRRCIVVDWSSQDKQLLGTLWLDVASGLVLKRQDYAPGDEQTLLYEALVSDIRYESEAPALVISDWTDLENLNLRTLNERQTPPKGQVTPTPTLGSQVIERETLPIDPSPPELNSSQRHLTFQYSQGEALARLQTGTAETAADLFADGYYLGSIQFGLPWGMRCQRSPDGSRIAFNMASDGTTAADDSLRWFSLDNPQVIYQPFAGFNVSDFAFAPDSRTLAVFAQAQDGSQSGIYLLDMATGEYEQLLELAWAESLVWRADGEYLAFSGRPAEADELAPMVVHANTGLITHQIEMDELDSAIFERWPVFAWEAQFPKSAMGMQTCAQPPK